MLLKPFKGTTQQQSPFRLDGSNSLSRGLVFAFSGHLGIDVVNNIRPTITGVTEIGGYGGKHAFSFAGGAMGASDLNFGVVSATADLHENAATWAFLYTATATTGVALACQNDAGSPGSGWQVFSIGGADGRLALNCERPGTDVGHIITTACQTNTLQTLVVTYDGTNNASGIKIYNNSILGTQDTGSSNGVGTSSASTNNLYLGRRTWTNAISHGGHIYVALIANRTWSQAEARTFHNDPYSAFQTAPNLIYSFSPFLSGSGTSSISFTGLATTDGTLGAASTVATTFSASATGTRDGSLVTQSDIVFSTNTTLSGSEPASATSAITITSTGTITGASSVSSQSDIAIATSATITGVYGGITNIGLSTNLLPIIPAHTIALYQFQDNKDDSSGNIRNLTIEAGTEQYTDLWPGSSIRAFDFNGSTSLIAAFDSAFLFTGDFTIQFIGVRSDNNNETFWSSGFGTGPFSVTYGLTYESILPAFSYANHSTPLNSLIFHRDISNELHLFSLVRKDNIVRFFIDNNEVDSISKEVTVDTPFGSELFRVGARQSGNYSRTRMASVRVLDIARTDNEILFDYTTSIANTSDILATSHGTALANAVLSGTTSTTWSALSLVTIMTTGQTSMQFGSVPTMQGLIRILATSSFAFTATGTGFFPNVTSLHFTGSGLIRATGPLVSNQINILFETGTSVLINVQLHGQAGISFDAQLFPLTAFGFPARTNFINLDGYATGKIKVNSDIIRSSVQFLTNEHRAILINTNKHSVTKVS